MPEHHFVEVASVVRRAELSTAISTTEAAVALDALELAPLRRVQIRPLLSSAWTMRGHLTIYDALYVALADHLQAVLVTADRRLAQAPGLLVRTLTP